MVMRKSKSKGEKDIVTLGLKNKFKKSKQERQETRKKNQ